MSKENEVFTDDLVKRLYDRRVCSPAQNSCRNDFVLDQAADRIEQLAATNEELEAKLSKSEALLAKAVAALDEAVYLLDPDEKDMMRKAGVYRIVTTLAELSSVSCANLKGETDE